MAPIIYDIPNELLINIFEQIERPSISQHHDVADAILTGEARQDHWNAIVEYRHTMNKIRSVDRRFYCLATPLRFRLLFTDFSAVQIDRLLALTRNSRLPSYVRGIEIGPYQALTPNGPDLRKLGQALRGFPALEELAIDWYRAPNDPGVLFGGHHAWRDLLYSDPWPSLKKVWLELGQVTYKDHLNLPTHGDATLHRSFELLHVDYADRSYTARGTVQPEVYLRQLGTPQRLVVKSTVKRPCLRVSPGFRLQLTAPAIRKLELYKINIGDAARDLAAALNNYMQPQCDIILDSVNVIHTEGHWEDFFDNLRVQLRSISARYLGYYVPYTGEMQIWSESGLTRLDEILDVFMMPQRDPQSQETYRRLREKNPVLLDRLEKIKRYEKWPIYYEIIEDLRETACLFGEDTTSISKLKRRNDLRDMYTERNRYIV